METEYKDFEKIVGSQIRDIRLSSGISQEDLAIYTGLDRSYISMIENGKRNPTLLVVFKICSVLNIAPNILIQRIEKIYEGNSN
ncbi:helix-turn-helix domain-containing protein [Sphingobacterium spiritivorum]|uniref:helix-turn-helix domain-containing protein n=1 Tax=Sphingobacterium spiritivorum TaxID=258 RepID=UPI003DA4F1A4